MMRRAFYLLLTMLVLAGCASTAQHSASEEPKLVQALPKSYGGYDYRGYQVYPTRELGVSFRYVKRNEQFHHADIYVYPVPAEAQGKDQREIVLSASHVSMQEIFEAGRRGYYNNVKGLRGEMRTLEGNVMTVSEFSFLRDNLKIYSLLYLTEDKGMLIKARVSMPYDERYLDHKDVDSFLAHMFGVVEKELK